VKQKVPARLQPPLGKAGAPVVLGEQPVDNDGCLTLENHPVEGDLGIADGKDVPQVARRPDDRRWRRNGLIALDEIANPAGYDSMANSGLARRDLKRDLPEPVSVPGYVSTNELLKHLRGGHG
jgi:hypothetical protein